MGCDIHSFAERKRNDKWESVGFSPFDDRNYGVFGFLAGVRNYSDVPTLAPQRGLPADVSADVAEEYEHWSSDAHSASWLSVEELSSFNYDAQIEDRRVTVQTGPNSFDGGATAKPGGGKMETWREFLGPVFFRDLEKLKEYEAGRIVFWFDN